MRNPGHSSLGYAGPLFQRLGAATLVAGTDTVPGLLTNNTAVIYQRETLGGVPGFLSLGALVTGAPGSIDIDSTDAGDTSDVQVMFVQGGPTLGDVAVEHQSSFGPSLGAAVAGVRAGSVTLVAGTANITPRPTPLSDAMFLYLWVGAPAGVQGHLTHSTLAGNPANVTITSSNAADVSTIGWMLFDPAALGARQSRSIGSAIQPRCMSVGTATLVAGTITVVDANYTPGRLVLVQRTVVGGTPGQLAAPTAPLAGQFDVDSSNVLDTSTFKYAILDVDNMNG